MRAMRSRPMTGKEGMVGLVGVTKTALTPIGQVAVHGELWTALSDQPVEAGVRVEVMGMDGLTLRVRSTLKNGVHDVSF